MRSYVLNPLEPLLLALHPSARLLSASYRHGRVSVHALVPVGQEQARPARYRIVLAAEGMPLAAPGLGQAWGFLGTLHNGDATRSVHVFWLREG